MVRMFADDTKLFANTSIEGMNSKLQDDIKSLENWAREWQLTFNASKCKVMYLGSRNRCCKYVMEKEGETVELERTRVEKDLGVHIDDDLKLSKHAEAQVNKANKLLGLIRRSLTYLDHIIMGPCPRKTWHWQIQQQWSPPPQNVCCS